MEKNKTNRIGALWLTKSKNNNTYLSGYINIGQNKYRIAIFKNNYHKYKNSPDYNILLSDYKNYNTPDNSDTSNNYYSVEPFVKAPDKFDF